MENTQVTSPDINVVQVKKEETVMETNSVHDEIIDEVKRIITVSEDGIKQTENNENLNSLFKNIQESASELLPVTEKLNDFETLTDELKNAGDILAKIIKLADKGFTLTDDTNGTGEPKNNIHYSFSEILMIADTEIREYIPTPVETK